MDKLWQNEEWLKQEYQRHGTSTIAKKCNRDDSTITYWLKKFKIPLRTRSESLKLTDNRKAHVMRSDYFNEIDSHEKAYWLGFLMADGTMREYRSGCYMICFELALKDTNMVKAFIKAIGYDGKIYTDSKRARVIIANKELTDGLLKHGIHPNKTGKERVPNISEQYLSSFIRGYFDGDGCIQFKQLPKRIRAKFHLICANRKMLEDIKNIFIKLAGIKPSDKMVHEKYTMGKLGKNKVFELETASMPNIAKIYDYLYVDNTYMQRKKNIFENYMSYYAKSPRVVKRYSPNCLETSRAKQK